MRSCLQCPICTSSLQLQSFPSNTESNGDSNAPSLSSKEGGPYILSCPYCTWSTLEVGIKFEKSINIISQLNKIQNGSHSQQVLTSPRTSQSQESGGRSGKEEIRKSQFDALRDFYKSSMADANPTGSLGGLSSSFGLDSPSYLSRLLTTYGVGGLQKQKQKPKPMREADVASEGLLPEELAQEEAVVNRMRNLSWMDVVSFEQQHFQITEDSLRFVDQLQPVPTKLRSRRSKRCQECRYHLYRPDDKRHSARFKLRLLALNYIPRISAVPLNTDTTHVEALKPSSVHQYIITCRNPLYDPIRIKLGTPSTVPGSSGSRVTILCPQFEVGASTDVWDEALDPSKAGDVDRTSSSRGIPEAGKVWKKGRNWTSIVLEAVPGVALSRSTDPSNSDANTETLEISVLVRMEYFVDTSTESVPAGITSPEESPGYKSAKEEKVPKELEFWIVLGLGKIAR